MAAFQPKTPAQARQVASSANDPVLAQKMGVAVPVGQEFTTAEPSDDALGGPNLAAGAAPATGAKKPLPKKSPPKRGKHGGPAAQFGLPKSLKKMS